MSQPLSSFTTPNSPFLLLLGDPGTGKSLLALHIAAKLSRAEPPPFSLFNSLFSTPQSSIICSNEDAPDTIRSRLHAANANISHIAFNTRLTLDPIPTARTPFRALQPTPLLNYLRVQLDILPNPRLLVLDPFPSFFNAANASNSYHHILRALQPLLDLAHARQIAIIAINHVNKSFHPRSADPLEKSLGSSLFPNLADRVYLLTANQHPHLARHAPTRLLVPLKSPPPFPPALYFSIAPSPIAPTIRWSPSEPPPANPPPPSQNRHRDAPSPPHSAFNRAVQFLQCTLASRPIPSKTLLDLAQKASIAPRTLRRAKRHLQIVARYDGTRWLAHFPPSHPTHISPRFPK